MPCYSASRGVSGFTLIELLVVVVIAALLLVVAVPSFTDSFERNRIVSQANDVTAAFAFARSEAIRSNREVRICPSNAAQSGCGANWAEGGWLVWRDDNNNSTLDAAEILRVGQVSKKDTLTAVNSGGTAVSDIRFSQRGARVQPTTELRFTMKPTECTSGKPLVRRFTLSAAGTLINSCIKCGSESSTPPTLCD